MEFDMMLLVGFLLIGLFYVVFSTVKKFNAPTSGKPLSKHTETLSEFHVYKQKVAEEPGNPIHWVDWGKALLQHAHIASGKNVQRLRYNEVCSCFQQATTISPTYIPAWAYWGEALYDQYRVSKYSDILQVEGGHNKFRNALDLSPRSVLVWEQWQEALRRLADGAPQDQKIMLLRLADDCTAKITELSTPLTEVDMQAEANLAPLLQAVSAEQAQKAPVHSLPTQSAD